MHVSLIPASRHVKIHEVEYDERHVGRNEVQMINLHRESSPVMMSVIATPQQHEGPANVNGATGTGDRTPSLKPSQIVLRNYDRETWLNFQKDLLECACQCLVESPPKKNCPPSIA